jgi:stage II sporulation protein R
MTVFKKTASKWKAKYFSRLSKYIPYIIFVLGVISFVQFYKIENISASKMLAQNTIRFHVRANSDSVLDQNLKLKVKDAVVRYINENTKGFTSIKQTENFLVRNNYYIKNIAQKVIDENGFNYQVSSKFGEETFPLKYYGDIMYPQGEYISYTLSLGSGKGHNWWCVLYPPLSLNDTDEISTDSKSSGIISYTNNGVVTDSSKKLLKESMTNTEYNTIVKYKFKYLTFLNKFIK